MNRRHSVVLIAVALVLAVAGPITLIALRSPSSQIRQRILGLFSGPGGERSSGFCTLVDEAGSALLRTGILVRRGDVFIDPAGQSHRVTRVSGERALTVLAPEVGSRAPQPREPGSDQLGPVAAAADPAISLGGAPSPSPQAIPLGTARQVIVLYHTHSDESYIPDDGTASIYGDGGVYRVGDAMATALITAGFTVVHDRAAHDPHDGGAYPRSRRTLLQNLQYGPTLIFDVHRDSAPASEYLTTIDGTETARILIVIGGANPLYRGNLGVANRMKTTADSLYPGLTRGILVAGGNFNQDLTAAGILLEVGTESISRASAERAASLWADVTAAYLGPPGPGPPISANNSH